MNLILDLYQMKIIEKLLIFGKIEKLYDGLELQKQNIKNINPCLTSHIKRFK